jgi:hypothetical protein
MGPYRLNSTIHIRLNRHEEMSALKVTLIIKRKMVTGQSFLNYEVNCRITVDVRMMIRTR